MKDMIKRSRALVLLLLAGFSQSAFSQNTNVSYLLLDPDIITNYQKVGNPGFVRISLELVIIESNRVSEVERLLPLFRERALNVLRQAKESKVKSMSGREQIRLLMLDDLIHESRRLLGENVFIDIVFSKYLYH